MRIGRILYPVTSLGPGRRLGIWLQGCARNCPGCANPELQPFDEAKQIPLDILIKLATTAIVLYNLDGITITGGEPMQQAEELLELTKHLSGYCSDILVFTGYTVEELKAKNNWAVDSLLSTVISVLVDGPYIKERNRGERLRGSDNQNIHYLDKKVESRYRKYVSEKERPMDNFVADNGVIAAGIHPQEFMDEAKGKRWHDEQTFK